MDTNTAEYLLVVVALPLIIGALVRRWWLLLVVVAGATAYTVIGLDSGAFDGDHDWTPGAVAFVAVIFFWLPVAICTTVGVLIGRFIRRPRRPRATGPPDASGPARS